MYVITSYSIHYTKLYEFKQEYAKAQEELKRALEKLPDKKEIPSLLTSISSAAKDQGMSYNFV